MQSKSLVSVASQPPVAGADQLSFATPTGRLQSQVTVQNSRGRSESSEMFF